MGRQEFIRYQQSFRPNDPVATIRTEWDAKNLRQKQRWTKRYNAVNEEFDRLDPLQAGLDDSYNQFVAEWNQGRPVISTVADYANYKGQVNAIDWLYVEKNQEWREYVQLLQEFHDEEASHPNVNQASLNDTIAMQQQVSGFIRNREQRRIDLFKFLERPRMAHDTMGRARMPEHWLPPNRTRRQARFKKDMRRHKKGEYPGHRDYQAGETWRAAPLHMAGGQGTCILWLRFDIDEEIDDRVLRKETQSEESSWINPTKWRGDVRFMADREPLELALTQAMNDIQALHYTIKLRDDTDKSRHVDKNALTYTLYLHWMGKGTLHHLIHAYREANDRIPEPFIWYVAEALAMCGKAMAQGWVPDQNGNEVQPDEWLEIVHRDIKPANVFLRGLVEGENPPIYPDYDRPVLGDYGMAVETHADDDFNPTWYNNRSGTQGFLAPEQYKHMDVNSRHAVDDERLGEKTNVYGVGLVLYCMLNNTLNLPEPAWLGNPTLDNTLAVPVGGWSSQLRNLVRDCLLYGPAQRPTFDQILQRIQAATNEQTTNLARYMRSGNATPAQKQGFMPNFLPDVYAIGLSADQVGMADVL